MQVHLIDGTYELFRHFYAVPTALDADGRDIAAVRGVVHSVLAMVKAGATHIGVATDHVIESFRNRLYRGYKTGEGIDPALHAQFPLLEEALRALGVTVWAMVECEADDALASAAHLAAQDPRVQRVLVCTPDKDLAQCVRGSRVVQLDRRKNIERDHDGVVTKFGVEPASIPDLLALVGDAADGFPGIRGWGMKSAAAVLRRYIHLDLIPRDHASWGVNVSNPAGLNSTLRENYADALLFRDLATLRADLPLFTSVDELHWRGPTDAFASLAAKLHAAKTVRKPKPGRAPAAH